MRKTPTLGELQTAREALFREMDSLQGVIDRAQVDLDETEYTIAIPGRPDLLKKVRETKYAGVMEYMGRMEKARAALRQLDAEISVQLQAKAAQDNADLIAARSALIEQMGPLCDQLDAQGLLGPDLWRELLNLYRKEREITFKLSRANVPERLTPNSPYEAFRRRMEFLKQKAFEDVDRQAQSWGKHNHARATMRGAMGLVDERQKR